MQVVLSLFVLALLFRRRVCMDQKTVDLAAYSFDDRSRGRSRGLNPLLPVARHRTVKKSNSHRKHFNETYTNK
jgi:hypothetical protein